MRSAREKAEAKTKSGFTLIELLVVISIIALLLAILMPSLQKVKEQAKSTICQASLHGWALTFGIYAADYNDKWAKWPLDYRTGWWMETLLPYYDGVDLYNDEFRICASAKAGAGVDDGDGYGGAKKAWGPFADGTYGSYGINHYLYGYRPNIWSIDNSKEYFWGKISGIGSQGNVPLLMDSTWSGMFPSFTDPVPPSGDDGDLGQRWGWGIDCEMARVCLDRHNMSVNSSFTDLSCRKVELTELWDLKWHPQWERQHKTRSDFTDSNGRIWYK